VVKYERARLGGSMPKRRFKPKSPATASWSGRPMELIRPGAADEGTFSEHPPEMLYSSRPRFAPQEAPKWPTTHRTTST
jgi:hypothetical protein